MPDNDNPYLPPHIYELTSRELLSILRQYEEMLAALDRKDSPDVPEVKMQVKKAVWFILHAMDRDREMLPLMARLARARKGDRTHETRRHAETLMFRAASEDDALQDRRVQRRLKYGWEVVRVCEVTMPEFDLLPPAREEPTTRKYLVKMELQG